MPSILGVELGAPAKKQGCYLDPLDIYPHSQSRSEKSQENGVQGLQRRENATTATPNFLTVISGHPPDFLRNLRTNWGHGP